MNLEIEKEFKDTLERITYKKAVNDRQNCLSFDRLVDSYCGGIQELVPHMDYLNELAPTSIEIIEMQINVYNKFDDLLKISLNKLEEFAIEEDCVEVCFNTNKKVIHLKTVVDNVEYIIDNYLTLLNTFKNNPKLFELV